MSDVEAGLAPTEEQICAVVDCVCNHPRHRELLYKALVYCGRERSEAQAEESIAAQPEFAEALQEPRVLLRGLVRCGGLSLTEVDVEGVPLDDERRARLRAERNLTDEQLADLVAERRLSTTPAGRAAAALLAPSRRIAACCSAVPERENAFLAVLQFCETPRTLAQVKAFVDQNLSADLAIDVPGHRLEATYFIDRLDEAGALVWKDHAWVATEDGKRYLSSL